MDRHRRTSQKIGQAEVEGRRRGRGGGVESKLASRRGALNQRELAPNHVRPEFDVVRAERPGDGATVLKRVVELQEGYESGVTEAFETLNHKARYPIGLSVPGIHTTDRVAWKTQVIGNILAIIHCPRLNRRAPGTGLQFEQKVWPQRVDQVEL